MRLSFALPCLMFASFAAAQPTTKPADVLPSETELKRIETAAIFAETCNVAGLEWKPYYLAFMQVERRKDWTDKQITFIGTYFGAIQGFNNKTLSKRTFTQDEVAELRTKLEAETTKLKDIAATQPAKKRNG